MARDTLTGSRIRERRVMAGLKQADLARNAGISASYLNLIEHNRRRIGGKLLLDIAAILEVEPTLLSEGAEATLIATLREAASDLPGAGAEMDRLEEFAGRFPGWARLLSDCRSRVTSLERAVEALTDRMTHDPHLAESLHEMLSTVTAIHSAAAILAEPGELDQEWQARFRRNIYEDSERLAQASRGLVSYMEADLENVTELGVPQEELDAVLNRGAHHVPELEEGGTVEQATRRLEAGLSSAARVLLVNWLNRYAEDARALPVALLRAPLAEYGPDPAALAWDLKADATQVMRRLAALPPDLLPDPVGLAICDASGVLTYRKPLPDFPIPRFGPALRLWPLYRSLSRPWAIHATRVDPPSGDGAPFHAEALAVPCSAKPGAAEPALEAHMLIRPAP